VFTIPEVMGDKVVLDGKKVVIIGSGLSGLEAGLFWLRAVRDCGG
jgi:monoamine oxidase